jgi:hypothetical protein
VITINTRVAWASNLNANESLNLLNNQNATYALQDDGNFVFYSLYPQGNEMFKWVCGATNTGHGVVSPNFGRITAAQ